MTSMAGSSRAALCAVVWLALPVLARAEVTIECPGDRPRVYEHAWQAPCVATCMDGSWRIVTEEEPRPCLKVNREQMRGGHEEVDAGVSKVAPAPKPVAAKPEARKRPEQECDRFFELAQKRDVIQKVDRESFVVVVNGDEWSGKRSAERSPPKGARQVDRKQTILKMLDGCTDGPKWKVVDGQSGKVLAKRGSVGGFELVGP